MRDRPIAFAAYERLAEAYAARLETKPHNAYYERPATLSLLPDVRGRRVLDAGCGPGVYADELAGRGAEVVAIDASPAMVAIARRRLGRRATVRVADLERPLDFLDGEAFDLVLSALVLEYVEDWRATLGEFYRVLRGGGHLVASVSHPAHDAAYFGTEAYFDVERVGSVWTGFPPHRVEMPSFRRSLAETLNPFLEAGFRLERVLEPRPTEAFRQADPRHYEELMARPSFLCLRGVKGE